ncbi:CGNR zinc finger domain-containing protein [Streptomyces sp. NPDC058394]|uniref:CGNR zinc finger domain-containing protein n=1 Tax=Streptomyces sp. NPDC058394 TaxID=3346477 RepID=UPI00366188CB
MEESLNDQHGVPPAPGAEQYLALDLVNSVVTSTGGRSRDFLDSPAEVTRWLFTRGLASAEAVLREDDAERLRALRTHIRTLATSSTLGRPAPERALDALNEALRSAPAAALLHWDPTRGLHREADRPDTKVIDHALARLAADAADLLTGPDAERLIACGSTPCNRYLLRHGRRQWCSTRCGDRARAARAYARRTRSGIPDAR